MQRTANRLVGAWGRWSLGGVLVLALLSGSGEVVQAQDTGTPHAFPVVESDLPTYQPEAELAGQFTIAGSDTMQPMVAKLAAAFNRLQPRVEFVVEGGGSKTGIRKFAMGLSDQRRGDKARSKGHHGTNKASILASSRRLTQEETQAFASHHGYEPMELPIAIDAVSIYVNRENPIQGLTLDQVDAIFSNSRNRGFSEDVTVWGKLGLSGAWQNQPIHLYGRDKNSGTREFFMKTVLMGGELKEAVQEQPGSATEVLALARDPLGIGYVGVGFQSSFVRVVPVAERAGQPFITPSPETVANGTYPLSRFLYLYVDRDPEKKFDPALLEYLKFVNSREGQQVVARAQFYPLTSNQVGLNLAVLEGKSVATALAGPKSRSGPEPEEINDNRIIKSDE
jgi:phosphate transport system substrate-binding protein